VFIHKAVNEKVEGGAQQCVKSNKPG